MIGVIRNVGPCMKSDVHHLVGIHCKEYKENLVINYSSFFCINICGQSGDIVPMLMNMLCIN